MQKINKNTQLAKSSHERPFSGTEIPTEKFMITYDSFQVQLREGG